MDCTVKLYLACAASLYVQHNISVQMVKV